MRLMPLMVFLSVTILVVATGCKSTANQNGASQTGNQNTMSQNAESSQTANNSTTSDKTKTEEKPSNNPRYRIDAGQSRLTARVFVGGLLSAFGHDHDISIRDVAGEVQLTPDTIEPASLRMAIKASSIAETGREFSDKDRQDIDRAAREQALEAAKYPEIVFKSTKVSVRKTGEGQYRAKIECNLTLHGVTRPIVIPAQVTLNGDSLRAQGEFTIRHSDYNIKRLTAGAGLVKSKDEMKLAFDIVASKY